MRRALQRESPDLILSLGDLVDWYSDENRDFALDFMHSLNIPWCMTPGNHDAETSGAGGSPGGLNGWVAAGVPVHNRKISLDHLEGFLINSHNSAVPPETAVWLQTELDPSAVNAVFTHVPPDTPETRAAIHAREPHRNLTKYVQSHAPGLFEDALSGNVDAVWSGHLHFQTSAQKGRTHFQILSIAIHAYGKAYPEQGMLHILDTQTMTVRSRVYDPEG